MADMPWRREEAVRNALESAIYTIADVDLYSAVHDIIFDESTQIDWRRVEAILQERLPELELFGNSFETSTITLHQLSDFLVETGDAEGWEFLDYYCKDDPNSSVAYKEAQQMVLDYFNDKYTDPESVGTNLACATTVVRAAFKKYAFY